MSASITRIDPDRRDRAAFDRDIAEAIDALRAVQAGDLIAVHTAMLATTRAVRALLRHAWDAA